MALAQHVKPLLETSRIATACSPAANPASVSVSEKARVLGLLSPMWETKMQFQFLEFSLAQSQPICPSVSLCFSNKYFYFEGWILSLFNELSIRWWFSLTRTGAGGGRRKIPLTTKSDVPWTNTSRMTWITPFSLHPVPQSSCFVFLPVTVENFTQHCSSLAGLFHLPVSGVSPC